MKHWVRALARLLALLPLLASARVALQATDLSSIGSIAEAEIAAAHIPGAVVLVGQGDHVVYARAFGYRSLAPVPEEMTLDTVFDLASLTKVLATTPAVLHLVKHKKLALDTPVANYWPEFAANGKSAITVRHLLSHTSGLPAGIALRPRESAADLLRRIAQIQPQSPFPGPPIYSDLNFVVLGALVERVSGMALNRYADLAVFKPLGMEETAFLPDEAMARRTAPTINPDGSPRRAWVQDPLAARLDAVAGHAGLFSTGGDLMRFCQATLNGGARIWSESDNAQMFTPQTVVTVAGRTLGWEAQAPLASNRAALAPVGAIAHLGYTGTGLWIDPVNNVCVVVLSNRLHPDGRGDANPLRIRVVRAVANALGSLPPQAITTRWPQLQDHVQRYAPKLTEPIVQTGIDILEREGFSTLRGKRLALLTNRSAVDSQGQRTIDVLAQTPMASLHMLLSPEHGLGAAQEGPVADDVDVQTGLPIYSLYGKSSAPWVQRLASVDAVLVDLQDAGVRFYTYASTLAALLRAAQEAHVTVWVLDRPNPLNGFTLQGPMLDEDLQSFTAVWNVPLRHGLTLGEFARLYLAENQLSTALTVVAMQGYRRSMNFDDTGLPWIPPSPNLTSTQAAALYPAVGMVEGAEVSVGRGTDMPFEVVGAPWVDAAAWLQALNAMQVPGYGFTSTQFTPVTSLYAGMRCNGIRIQVTAPDIADAAVLGLALAQTLHRLYPQFFTVDKLLGSIGSRSVLAELRAGRSPMAMAADWQPALEAFRRRRQPFLLYP